MSKQNSGAQVAKLNIISKCCSGSLLCLLATVSLLPACYRYHSHPIFAPKPSQKDSENQRNYQALFRCEKTRLEPFIGAIVGPYDLQLPTQVSMFCPLTAALETEKPYCMTRRLQKSAPCWNRSPQYDKAKDNMTKLNWSTAALHQLAQMKC